MVQQNQNKSHQKISGPEWDLHSIYDDFQSTNLIEDETKINQLILSLSNQTAQLSSPLHRMDSLTLEEQKGLLPLLWQIQEKSQEAQIILAQVKTFANSHLTCDGGLETAKVLLLKAQKSEAELDQALKAFQLFLVRAPDDLIEHFLSHEKTRHLRFTISHKRQMRPYLLSLEQEQLITALSLDGHVSWGMLYDEISSQLQCQVPLPSTTSQTGEVQVMGMSAAQNLLRGPDRPTRESAFKAIARSWETCAPTCATILNSLAGFRWQVSKKRSLKNEMHFLTSPLHDARMSLKTLLSMLQSIEQNIHIGREALQWQAKAMGVERMAPWDLLAQAPLLPRGISQQKAPTYTFAEAMDLIIQAFNSLHPQMGEFASMMQKRNWIEGRSEGRKRPGAYCTSFAKAREPRVYMTYAGTMSNVITLAHELGHAFHYWVLRDLPYEDQRYPMTLAETASLLAQAVVNDYLLQKAASPEEMYLPLWNEAQEAATMLLNIPARFYFEKSFYEQREKKSFSVQNFKDLMRESWEKSYGPALSEMDEMFWASKLHFYMTKISFYNFPYTFGYLFSMGVYAQRKNLQGDFFEAYTRLLKDTGRMSVEQLAQEHLQVDLQEGGFWRDSLSLVQGKVERFAGIVQKLTMN